jgi:proline iminopeptidase
LWAPCRAWFADQDLAAYLAPPMASSVTGAAVAARLRRDGYDWTASLRALSTPALVLHGERDALPPSVAFGLAALLGRATVVVLPDAGHMPFWEAPHRFFSLASDFLAASPSGLPRSRPP